MICTSHGVGQVHVGEGHTFMYRRDYCANGTQRGCLFVHGAGVDNTQILSAYRDVPAAIARAGIPVLACDLAGDNWGNDTGQARLTEAKTFMQTQFGTASGPCLVYAGSMGGLTALNWQRNNPTLVSAIHGTIMATDLADLHDNDRLGSAAGIETAYGGLAAYNAAVATHNPALFASGYSTLPIRITYSTNDPAVVPATITAFAAASGATLVSVGAQGHADTGIDPVAAAAWLRQYAT